MSGPGRSGSRAPRIRPARLEDLDAVHDICLRTGAAGEDASTLLTDHRLLGDIFAAPYVVLQPDLAFVIEDADGVGAYVVGTDDTRAFEQRMETDWLPAARAGRPLGSGEGLDALFIALLHHPSRAADTVVATHPAHLHIDLLPRLQGRGLGRRLLATFLGALRDRRVPGVHFGVNVENRRALGFYEHLGFEELGRDPVTVTMGMRLDRSES